MGDNSILTEWHAYFKNETQTFAFTPLRITELLKAKLDHNEPMTSEEAVFLGHMIPYFAFGPHQIPWLWDNASTTETLLTPIMTYMYGNGDALWAYVPLRHYNEEYKRRLIYSRAGSQTPINAVRAAAIAPNQFILLMLMNFVNPSDIILTRLPNSSFGDLSIVPYILYSMPINDDWKHECIRALLQNNIDVLRGSNITLPQAKHNAPKTWKLICDEVALQIARTQNYTTIPSPLFIELMEKKYALGGPVVDFRGTTHNLPPWEESVWRDHYLNSVLFTQGTIPDFILDFLTYKSVQYVWNWTIKNPTLYTNAILILRRIMAHRRYPLRITLSGLKLTDPTLCAYVLECAGFSNGVEVLESTARYRWLVPYIKTKHNGLCAAAVRLDDCCRVITTLVEKGKVFSFQDALLARIEYNDSMGRPLDNDQPVLTRLLLQSGYYGDTFEEKMAKLKV